MRQSKGEREKDHDPWRRKLGVPPGSPVDLGFSFNCGTELLCDLGQAIKPLKTFVSNSETSLQLNLQKTQEFWLSRFCIYNSEDVALHAVAAQ